MENKILVESIQKMKTVNVFKNYIEYIRFPFYRNLEPDSKITFDFPLTFFVGKNGGGKSSTLQSLYGCPKGKSLGDFWFSTELDPIKESKERNCFIYGYTELGNDKEVLKHRGKRSKSKTKKADPDYWETSKPIKNYGMDISVRNNPIDKNVEYVDFRSELSAFDRYMYFMPFNSTKSINSKQDFVRKYSKKIKEGFNSKKVIIQYKKPSNKIVKTLTDEEVKVVSKILGKEYSSIEILDHRFLKEWGFSVRFTSSKHSYSEAFAGSGETAIIVLIHKIHNCKDETLLLLDEPEVSLHSGAQKRLRNYLLEQIKIKKLQVIISTHSPFFLEGMPSNSIKVFSMNPISGLFHVENEREPKEAFYELEISDSNNKKQIIVEDKLAKNILEMILDKIGKDVLNTFEIKYLPGGASALKQRLVSYMEIDFKPIIIFDGDQKKIDNHIDIRSMPLNEIDSVTKLDALIKKQVDTQISFVVDGNKNGGNDDQKIKLRINYLDYYLNDVFYLPKQVPEEIIWDDMYALSKIETFYGTKGSLILDDVKKDGNAKDWFVNLCLKIYGDSKFLDSLHHEFMIIWFNKKDDSFTSIAEMIDLIRKRKN